MIVPCGEELMMVYGPFHLLHNFPSLNSLTFELKSRTWSPCLNSFSLIWWSCHLLVLSL
jgi:hypothetical protein